MFFYDIPHTRTVNIYYLNLSIKISGRVHYFFILNDSRFLIFLIRKIIIFFFMFHVIWMEIFILKFLTSSTCDHLVNNINISLKWFFKQCFSISITLYIIYTGKLVFFSSKVNFIIVFFEIYQINLSNSYIYSLYFISNIAKKLKYEHCT